MEINEDIILIVLGILGFLAHCLMKAIAIKKNYVAANIEFDWKKDYLKRDSLAIILAVLPVFAWYFLFGEVAVKYPAIANMARVSFFTVGLSGSYFIQLWAGVAEKIGRRVVDAKTNISDSPIVTKIMGAKIEKEDVIKNDSTTTTYSP